jgi:hypothetical protein
MDDLDLKTTDQPNAGEMQKQFDDLRHLIVSILILVIIISGTFNIYLLRQWRSTSRDLAGIRPQAAQMRAEYQKTGPLMSDFVKKISDFGQSHQDFLPILLKYGIRHAPTTNALPPGQTPTAPKK